MSLQLVLGNSGSGKSDYLYKHILEKAKADPKTGFFLIVPEQFTLHSSRELVRRHKNHGILNIDVLSFQRLAYRVFDELGKQQMKILEETGQNFVLRRVAEEKKEELRILAGNMKKPGYLNEMKSMISELSQYRITPEALSDLAKEDSYPLPFRYRLLDIQLMYQGFLDYLKDNYVTVEEVLEVLAKEAHRSALLKDSVIVLDGFTGFTPIQYHLLEALFPCVKEMTVALTIDEREFRSPFTGRNVVSGELFEMTKKTMQRLSEMVQGSEAISGNEKIPGSERTQDSRKMQRNIKQPIWISHGEHSRFSAAPQLLFLEQNLFREVPRIYEGEIPKPSSHGKSHEDEAAIQIHRLPNPRQEILFAAGEMKRLVRDKGYRYRDIALICGDVESYGNYVREIFPAFEIPVFIDEKCGIRFHPMTEMIVLLLLIVESDFSYESVFAWLRCGLSGIAREAIDLLENYVLANRMRGYSVWQKKWVRIAGTSTPEELELVNETREEIVRLLGDFYQVMKGKSTVKEKTRALYQLIVTLNIQSQLDKKRKALEKAGNLSLAMEYAQIYKIVMDLFDKLVFLLSEEQMEVGEYRRLLEAGFSAATVGSIPPGCDQTLIGDMERSRLPDVKAVFFVGVNDGLIPKTGKSGGLLSQSERELFRQKNLNLAPDLKERAFNQRFYLYLNLTKPSRKLYLSYFHRGGDGKEAKPSYLISSIRSLFPQLAVSYMDEVAEDLRISSVKTGLRLLSEGIHVAKRGKMSPTFRALYQWFLGKKEEKAAAACLDAAFYSYQKGVLGEDIAKELYGQILMSSVTRLERFAACAYGHFMNYGIGLKERELGEFAPVDMGSLFHEALEAYANKIEEEGYTWFDVPKALTERCLADAIEKAFAKASGFDGLDPRMAHVADRMKRILQRTTDTLSAQMKESSFHPEGYEISFSAGDNLKKLSFALTDTEQMQLQGRIDRVDVKEEKERLYVRVVDYKSGNAKFQLLSFYYGLQLQLVVYLNAATELLQKEHPNKEIVPAGMFYYHIDDPMIEGTGKEAEEEITQQIRERLALDGIQADLPGTMPEDGKEISKSANKNKLPPSDMKLLSNYVNHTLRSLGKEIYQGKIKVNPYRLKEKTACDYCPYHGICGFDDKGYRRLREMGDEEVLEKMGSSE
ncbi:ATP-dependent helicase/deoxyribonuclease subunit B [Clostridia bacterium]|nr:ATP-dependent helicase/deoxyribonuclease subunit B [Clostridia bacterium]